MGQYGTFKLTSYVVLNYVTVDFGIPGRFAGSYTIWHFLRRRFCQSMVLLSFFLDRALVVSYMAFVMLYV